MTLNFGAFGLKALEPERITARQIEAARRAITRAMKRAGRVWIRIFPDVPVSTKPAEVRMGSGKGAPGVLGLPRRSRAGSCSRSTACRRTLAREALTLGAAKLPIKTQVRRPDRRRVMAEAMTRSATSAPRRRTSCGRMLLDLRKEQFNLRFQRATGQQEGRRACARCGARSRA